MKKKVLLIITILSVAYFSFISPACAQNEEYELHPSDVLKMTVHEQPDLTTKCRVTQDGYITFPLLGELYVVGHTVQGLETKIKRLLEKDYLPGVSCLIQ